MFLREHGVQARVASVAPTDQIPVPSHEVIYVNLSQGGFLLDFTAQQLLNDEDQERFRITPIVVPEDIIYSIANRRIPGADTDIRPTSMEVYSGLIEALQLVYYNRVAQLDNSGVFTSIIDDASSDLAVRNLLAGFILGELGLQGGISPRIALEAISARFSYLGIQVGMDVRGQVNTPFYPLRRARGLLELAKTLLAQQAEVESPEPPPSPEEAGEPTGDGIDIEIEVARQVVRLFQR